MATDRSSSLGIEVVRYRVFRLEKLEKDSAKLSVEIRQYATKGDVTLGAVQGEALQIARFDAQGKGAISWSAGALLPAGNQVNLRMQAALKGPPPGRACRQSSWRGRANLKRRTRKNSALLHLHLSSVQKMRCRLVAAVAALGGHFACAACKGVHGLATHVHSGAVRRGR